MRTACEECRETVSARLDGEELPGEAAVVDAHLAVCGQCRSWAEGAARVTRLTRARLAEPAPDLVDGVLAAADLDPPSSVRPRGRARWVDPVRFALGGVGLAQLALAVDGVVAAGQHAAAGAALSGATAVHFAHESSAWNLAVGIGFLGAATARRRSHGLVPVVGAFVVALAGLSALDVLAGRVEPGRLLGHGLVVVGLVLLVLLQRLTGTDDGGTGRRRDRSPAAADTAGPSTPHRWDTDPGAPEHGNPLRPAGRAA